MSKWTPDSVRRWLLESLYEKYMLDPRSQCDYVKRPVEVEETPSFPDIVRELEWLQALKHVKITEQYSHVICARLTPFGRALMEQSDQNQPAKRREIGFEPDEE